MSKYNLPEMMSYIIGALLMVIVFSIAYAYLKPHRLHHARPLSTLALKGTYLIYLLVMLLGFPAFFLWRRPGPGPAATPAAPSTPEATPETDRA